MSEIDISNTGIASNSGQAYAAVAVNQTFNFTNNSMFYALVNPNYYDYYWRIVRVDLAWYDGYVIGFHNVQNGIASTHIGTSIVKNVAQQIFGKNVTYKNGAATTSNSALNFIANDWAIKVNADVQWKLDIEYTLAAGTSIIKTNQNGKDLWIEAVRADYFYFETDFMGNINDVTFFIKSYINTNASNTPSQDGVNYFLVEHRYYRDMPKYVKLNSLDTKTNQEKEIVVKQIDRNVPVVEYQVHRYVGQMLNNVNMSSLRLERGLNWTDIPKGVREIIKKDYTAYRVNEPLRLPFTDLGCDLVRNGRYGSVPQAQFGESILTNVRGYLTEYEMMNAYSVRDMFNGQGQVGVPKALSQGDVSKQNYGSSIYSDSKMNYQTYVGNPDTQKPIITQFNLRGEEWETIKDDILKKIATTIGMAPKLLASYLANSGAIKTATQIDSDDGSVISFIENKRGVFEPSFNSCLKRILKFYGFADSVEIKFGTPSLINKQDVLKTAYFEYNNGLIDLRECLSQIFPDADEQQLDVYEAKAKARQLEMKQDKQVGIEKENPINQAQFLNQKL
jgi:hypothetical protein